MTPNLALQNFRAFLCAAYPQWKAVAAQVLATETGTDLDDAFCDWAQANWELLVERPLCEAPNLLNIYSAGSDYEDAAHSRVFFHAELPTHDIVCVMKGQTVIDHLTGSPVDLSGFLFDKFVARVDTWYEDVPPFDHVLLYRGGVTPQNEASRNESPTARNRAEWTSLWYARNTNPTRSSRSSATRT
jgi:hypothetical protein